ncbi:hypothetical protein [Peptacetobacter hiranonis]|uniref:hypothetical protein n=1 Tax=Peptacetobacter hiranonis TaxID=89152 RepID=UPI0022E61F8F|nr:hypothetical protein [Peptacetobacter hiranonis]
MSLTLKQKKILSELVEIAISASDMKKMGELYKVSMKQILNRKYDRVRGNEREYRNSLKKNILYFWNLSEDQEKMIKLWINNNRAYTMEKFNFEMDKCEKYNKQIDINYSRNHEKLNKYDNKETNILEIDYVYLSAYTEILLNSMCLLIQNSNIFKILEGASSEKVIDYMKRIIYVEINIYIGKEI